MDTGHGAPIVLIPGIQGRWEWMSPAVRALGASHRVLTFSLGDVPADREPAGMFDRWIAEIDRLLDHAGEPRAAIIGVSFGGLIATRYAARRRARTAALVLASSPSPRMRLDEQSEAYLRYPRLAVPFFALRGCRRLLPEALAARVTWTARARFIAGHVGRVMGAPIEPRLMAHWIQAWKATDIEADCRQVTAPTLVLTGEAHLDRVVPVEQSLDVTRLIAHAEHRVLSRTGHIGLVSRPVEFARLVTTFVDERFEWPAAATGREPIGRAG